ncbi:4-hydroxy-tetrahydrodipicolinate synthase [Planctomycetes bacterium Pan216]|uniref:4-hydroxy-tetrahydrodipicolinate synthase n=1 Tax=Kolteria novifilia TaxID=2527975 RepID=A0A518B456_9BACT|nr:4-hydroxy-tetrahydrodipicolinate synthase [Planctomycetes bacterium Pan216]
MRKGEQFAGVSVAMVTPFTADEQLDIEGLDRLVDWHVEQGTKTLVPVGTTGESPTLDHDEHRRVIERVAAHAAGRIQVMAGTGSNSTREAIELTRFAKEVGVDGALMVAPYYNKPTQEGFLRHFATVADAVEIPIVLYNIPGRTGANMLPKTINLLGEHPNIVAVKEATGSMDQACEILTGSQLTVLSGDDSLTLPLMAMGASGVVSVVANIVPKQLLELTDAMAKGDLAKARAVHNRLFALCKDMLTLATNPIPIKGAMKLLGTSNGVLRLPMTPLGDDGYQQLRKTLEGCEIL